MANEKNNISIDKLEIQHDTREKGEILITDGGKNDNENKLSIDATSFKISHSSSGKINEKRTPTGDN